MRKNIVDVLSSVSQLRPQENLCNQRSALPARQLYPCESLCSFAFCVSLLWFYSTRMIVAAAALSCVRRHTPCSLTTRHTTALQWCPLRESGPHRSYLKPWLRCIRWSHGVCVFVWMCICVSGGLAVSDWSCRGLIYMSDKSICREGKHSPINGWQSNAVMTSGVTDKQFNNWVQLKGQLDSTSEWRHGPLQA